MLRSGDSKALTPCKGSSRAARRRRMEIKRFKIVTTPVAAAASSSSSSELENGEAKRRKLEAVYTATSATAAATFSHRQFDGATENSVSEEAKVEHGKSKKSEEIVTSRQSLKISLIPSIVAPLMDIEVCPKFGVASVCGRRRDMEDAVAAHPSFCRELHFFGVYDGHGCSHAAMKCRERLHELLKEELEGKGATAAEAASPMEWKRAMERSFWQIDKDVVVGWNNDVVGGANCRCEMQSPDCDAVGSTAVVAVVTPEKIVVANCGDSRAVLCRNGKSVPLSSDHKPDRPDELNRIEAAGGRVIFWDGPRVLGVLAMSRAIGDNYLKPYVICEPEVTITDRTAEDDCLILASDGLWDVVSNDTACGVARMCLRGKGQASPRRPPCSSPDNEVGVETSSSGTGGFGGGAGMSDKACSDASMLLTKLALARHSSDNVSVVVVDLRRAT